MLNVLLINGHRCLMLIPNATSRPSTSRTQALQRSMRLMAALFVIAAGAGLFIGGAQPAAVGLFEAPWDKLAHLLTFALIGGASGMASGTRGWRLLAWCMSGALAIGVMDELHQTSLPGRSASWADLAADAAGGMLGAALLHLALRMMHLWMASRKPRANTATTPQAKRH